MAKSQHRKIRYPHENRPAKSRKRSADEDEPSRNNHIVNRPLTKGRKRHRDEDEPSRNHSPASQPRIGKTSQDIPRDEPSAKRIKPAVEHYDSWVYPPEFWDRLSKIPLIHEAVAELDRRTSARPSSASPPPLPLPSTGPVQDLALAPTKELARFARHGGPNLADLRGYPVIQNSNPPAKAMSSSSPSGNTKSTGPVSSRATKITDPTTKTKTSISPYNRAFEQHLTDHLINPSWKSLEPNLEDIWPALAIPRRSLSPSRFSDGAYKTFQRDNAQAKDEEDVRAYVVPTILGPREIDHPSAMSTLFGNLDPLTDGTLAPAKPDVYYGAHPEQLNRLIRDELRGHIIPSTMEDKPLAPNFFLEVKGPDGTPAVAARQARYDGALGARAIYSLQNYGKEEPVYDNHAYTFSSTYQDGQLKLYSHHPTTPTILDGRPEYHMTQLRTFSLTDTRESFVKGVTAFRNARDIAKQHRDSFIDAANARARQDNTPIDQDDINNTIEREHDSSSSSGIVVNNPEYVPQDAHDAFQHDIWNQSFNETPVVPRYLETEEGSQGASQASAALDLGDPSTIFATSFTSSFSTGQASSKRTRQSYSPPSSSEDSHSAKYRSHPGIGYRAAN